jgi:uncharacterized protein (TIGR03435 family)
MKRPGLCVTAVLAASFALANATKAQDKPKFEVASIKECKDKEPVPPSTSSPGRLSLACWPLWRLIADAYETFPTGVVDPQKPLVPLPLEGAPGWINAASYTIDAKAEGPQSGAMMRGPLMQSLLEDRFRVKVHRETREISGLVMTVAKGGAKLPPTQEGSCAHADPTDLTQSGRPLPSAKPWCGFPAITRKGELMVYDVRDISLDSFCRSLRPDGRSVIDQTGLTGEFDIHLEWEADPPQSAPDGQASINPGHQAITDAIRTQLGLRLDPGKGTRESLVIDRVEKPSGN